MLLIETEGKLAQAEYPHAVTKLTITVSERGRGGAREIIFTIYQPDGASDFGGQQIVQFVMGAEDTQQLKRNL